MNLTKFDWVKLTAYLVALLEAVGGHDGLVALGLAPSDATKWSLIISIIIVGLTNAANTLVNNTPPAGFKPALISTTDNPPQAPSVVTTAAQVAAQKANQP